MTNTAIITGAGSGVGRAVALRMAGEGWTVALVGRTPKGLEETKTLAGDKAANLHVFPCDIGDPAAAEKTVAAAVAKLGTVTALINCAGTNIPKRSLEVLNATDYQSVIATNLNGAVYFTLGVLPAMRKAGRGTVVNIVSDAGMFANAKAGAAYVASKFGVSGLTQSINCEERQHGIRACAIYPGDIATAQQYLFLDFLCFHIALRDHGTAGAIKFNVIAFGRQIVFCNVILDGLGGSCIGGIDIDRGGGFTGCFLRSLGLASPKQLFTCFFDKRE